MKSYGPWPCGSYGFIAPGAAFRLIPSLRPPRIHKQNNIGGGGKGNMLEGKRGKERAKNLAWLGVESTPTFFVATGRKYGVEDGCFEGDEAFDPKYHEGLW